MKGLDTPVLLAILRGRPEARRLLRTLHGEELCTTELNLFELEVTARREAAAGRERRLAVLERLRRKLSVLPIDGRAVQAAAARLPAKLPAGIEPTPWLIAGALEANGCAEWITRPGGKLPDGFHVKVRISG